MTIKPNPSLKAYVYAYMYESVYASPPNDAP